MNVTPHPLDEELRKAVAWLQASGSLGMLMQERDGAGARLNLYRNGLHESAKVDQADPDGLAKALVTIVNVVRLRTV